MKMRKVPHPPKVLATMHPNKGPKPDPNLKTNTHIDEDGDASISLGDLKTATLNLNLFKQKLGEIILWKQERVVADLPATQRQDSVAQRQDQQDTGLWRQESVAQRQQ